MIASNVSSLDSTSSVCVVYKNEADTMVYIEIVALHMRDLHRIDITWEYSRKVRST